MAAAYCSGEILAKATWDDPVGKPRVVASDGLLTDRRNRLIVIASTELIDRTINTQSGPGSKVFNQLPTLLVGVATLQ